MGVTISRDGEDESGRGFGWIRNRILDKLNLGIFLVYLSRDSSRKLVQVAGDQTGSSWHYTLGGPQHSDGPLSQVNGGGHKGM